MVFAIVLITFGWSGSVSADVFSEGSVVLVLKLVSATRVQPTTGVVVSAEGLVIVSAGFIAEGDEIVVMDGGTDISTYARPATLIDSDEASGLAVVSVPGLSRKPILLSTYVAPAEGDLHLAAFPPAEQIASGAAPLWLPVDVMPASGRNQWRVTNADSIPNVSGPVLDACGFLTGINLASGAQSLTSGSTMSLIGAPMLDALTRLNVKLAPASCDVSAGSQRTADSLTDENAAELASRQPVSVDENMPKVIDREKNVITPIDIEEQKANPVGTDSLQGDSADALVSQPATSPPTPSVWSWVPWWLWLLIAVLLAAAIFKLGALWRLVNRSPAPAAANLPRQAPVVEPPTIELLRGANRSSDGLACHATAHHQMPDIGQLPDGFNAIVCITGALGNGSNFSRYCIADKSHIDIIIGRGDADISIESATVSRQHARLKGSMNALTFSDLNSGNGTFIGAVACLPGEIMYIGPSDEIVLGDVRFKIAVKYKIERPS